MKKLYLLPIVIFSAISVHSQSVTYTKLIGTYWTNIDQFETIHFIDSSHYDVMVENKKLFTVVYALDNSTNPAIIIIEGDKRRRYFKKLIRFENSRLLKIQSLYCYKHKKWIKKETPENTDTYIKLD
ncbi:hypothetical protein [Ferruginibacter albus]|uniref:hypothetical protein n=1 Tax=Ferruginibacter albus TaxID=2875540 RepID=UPI001CC5C257|nr:hypothetical protein [Ferruginibacter albus]UAY52558.1 hypothetical protein K9M53_02430 [Ferruginibacter albus]